MYLIPSHSSSTLLIFPRQMAVRYGNKPNDRRPQLSGLRGKSSIDLDRGLTRKSIPSAQYSYSSTSGRASLKICIARCGTAGASQERAYRQDDPRQWRVIGEREVALIARATRLVAQKWKDYLQTQTAAWVLNFGLQWERSMEGHFMRHSRSAEMPREAS